MSEMAPAIAFGAAVPYFEWDLAFRYNRLLLQGLRTTLEISVVIMALGLVLGIFVAAGRLSKNPLISRSVAAYIELFRGTPALVQLVWFYYCLPIFLGVSLPGYTAIVVALTLNVSAFYGEAYRSGIQALPKDQIDSADVLGLSYFQRLRYVVAPQAFRIVIPVLLSLSISLFKDTSLVSTLGVGDLMYEGRVVATQTYRPIEILTSVAAIYFLIAFPVSLLTRRLELRMARAYR
ncbi:MAG: amino acid ABC transporter permease [Bacillati bacterium ANGP1]|uniref:Amino acid ABC transporter permease n=1 Tax=Candidatus Segetimicrobium genomatis TaxID=2569760 RepID=A0A537LLM0_9BACT|nr:MAG: amino acid ABC transporter permease [Terrabacteria group bacterium ANGP1]TMJ08919.1 MAG: amino acid ABC transporter permease [Terrabacteria group bacterium ANGP1]